MAQVTRRTRNNQPATSLAAPIVLLGALACVAAAALRLPSVPFLWLSLVVAAWMEPSVILTGPRDPVTKSPTAADDFEQRRYDGYLWWRQMKSALLFPTSLFKPGWPVRTIWVLSVLAGLVAVSLPVAWPVWLKQPAQPDTVPQAINASHLANFICALVLAAALTSVRRTAEQGRPATRFNHVRKVVSTDRLITALAVGALVLVVAAGLVVPGMFGGNDQIGVWLGSFPTAGWAALGLTTTLLVLHFAATRLAVAQWERVQGAIAQWRPRWEALKVAPAPSVDDVRDGDPSGAVEGLEVVSFTAPPGRSAADIVKQQVKIAAEVGSGAGTFVMTSPVLDGAGAPQPGTADLNRFRILVAAPGATDLSALPTGEHIELATLLIEAAMTVARTSAAMDPMPIVTVQPLFEPDTQPGARVWATTWSGDLRAVRMSNIPFLMSQTLGVDVQVDHRKGVLYVGDLESVELDGGLRGTIDNLRTEDEWDRNWADGGPTKHRLNLPVAQHGVREVSTLRAGMGSIPITRLPFLVRKGVDPRDYFGTEQRMAAALNAAGFVAITGWPGSGGRPGDRHALGLTIYYAPSQTAVPTTLSLLSSTKPGVLQPMSGSNAEAWVAAGIVNTAFMAAKLARPELIDATCLTKPRAGKNQMWEISLRLHDGVTMGDVRAKASTIRASLGVPWLRMESIPDGVRLFAGGDPDPAVLVSPDRDVLRLTNLDWSQAFVDANLVTVDGSVPTVTSVGALEHNDAVQRLVISLPSGLSAERFKGALAKLATSTNNAFCQAYPSRQGASFIELLVSRTHPLPERVAFDFDAVDAAQRDAVPFATGITGEPVEQRFRDQAFVLVAGTQGSGKSVTAQGILYGCAVQRMQIVVVDFQKAGVDFAFLSDHQLACVTTAASAEAAMKAVYAEGRRRLALMAKHHVGNILDLPDDIQPPRLVVFFDEFTSAMGREALPDAGNDPEAQRLRAEIEADNRARATVGQYVGKIVRELRAAKISLILATQKLDKTVLDKIPGGADLRDNLGRSIFGNASQGAKMSALREPFDAPSLGDFIPKGRGLWEPLTARVAEPIQCWFAPQGTDTDVAAPGTFKFELDARVPKLDPSALLDLKPFMPKQEVLPGQIIGDLPPSLRAGDDEPSYDTEEVIEVESFDLDLDLDDLDSGDFDDADRTAQRAVDPEMDRCDADGPVSPALSGTESDPPESSSEERTEDPPPELDMTFLEDFLADLASGESDDGPVLDTDPFAGDEFAEPESPVPGSASGEGPGWPKWTPPPKVTTDDW